MKKIVILFIVILIIGGTIVGIKYLKKDNQTNSSNEPKYVPNYNTVYSPNIDKGKLFLPIEKIESDSKGTIVTGTISSGSVSINDKVEIMGLKNNTILTKVLEIEKEKSNVKSANKGDKVNILLKNTKVSDIEIGQIVLSPNYMKPTNSFRADIHVFTEEEGNKEKKIISSESKLSFEFIVDIAGTITVNSNIKQVDLGKDERVIIELEKYVVINEGTEFLIKSNQNVIGKGKVLERL